MTSHPDILKLINPHLRHQFFDVGHVIHSPARPSDSFHWIFSGTVRFSNVSRSGELLDLFSLRKNDSFGEISILSDRPPPHIATISETSEIGVLTAIRLKRMIDDQPVFRAWIMKRLASKLSSAYLLFDEVRSQSPRNRVWRYLSWLAANGYASDEGTSTITITHAALASRLGLSRATVSIVLRDLKREGLISTGYGSIELHLSG